jgi:hypothetical protein
MIKNSKPWAVRRFAVRLLLDVTHASSFVRFH